MLQVPCKDLKKHLQAAIAFSKRIVHDNLKRPRKESIFLQFSKVRESPLFIYLGMFMHAKTRNKGIINRLSSLGLSIPYKRVLELSVAMGIEVLFQ